jgi:hypothetical protein
VDLGHPARGDFLQQLEFTELARHAEKSLKIDTKIHFHVIPPENPKSTKIQGKVLTFWGDGQKMGTQREI